MPAPLSGYFSEQIAEARRFHLDPGASETSALAVVSGGCEHCAPEYEIHRKSFPFRGLEFVAQGKGTVVFADGKHEILAGSLFSYGPRTSHEILTDPGDPLVKYFVDFTGTRSTALLKGHGLSPGTVIQTSAPGDIMAIFDDLVRNGLACTPYSGRITTAILEHLLLKIAETAIPNGSSSSPAFATYRKALRFIQDHWKEVRSLAEIAAACHVDPAYLCRLFQRFDRQSPYQLLLRLRINHAADELRAGEKSVAEIAEELHFSDAFHFSRMFKKLIGTPPSKFARMSGR